MAGAELLALRDHHGFGGALGHLGFDRLAAVAGDDDDAGGLQRLGGPQGMGDQRGPGQGMQDLGQVGIHPGALPGGEDDDGDGHEISRKLDAAF